MSELVLQLQRHFKLMLLCPTKQSNAQSKWRHGDAVVPIGCEHVIVCAYAVQ